MFFFVTVDRRLESSVGEARGGQSMASISFRAKTKSKNYRCLPAGNRFALSVPRSNSSTKLPVPRNKQLNSSIISISTI